VADNQDPYASIAKPIQVATGTVGGHAPDQAPAGVAQGQSNPSAASGDVDPYAGIAGAQQNPEEPYSMQLLHGIPGAAKSIGKGLLEGAGSDVANLTGSAKLKALTTPSGDENDVMGQKFGKGVEQGAEFLIPGLGEEKAMSLVPDLKYAKPLAKVGYNALASGALNKAQGGDFGTGALVGGVGSAGGQVLNEMAPAVAEKSLGIRGKFDRSFNKTPGLAALEETKGIRPETVAASAKERIGELGSQVNDMADQASTKARPQPRGLLPAPTEDVPLHSAPDVAGTPSQPTVLNQPDRPMPKLLESQTGNRTLPSSFHSDIFPDQLPQGSTNILDGEYQPMAGETQGMRADQYMGQVPGDRGGVGQVQGVLRQRPSAPIGQAPIPTTEANASASLVPARSAVSNAMGSAERQNAAGTHGQLQNMQDFLSRRFSTGEQIPENVTPRDLLDLRRGFNEEHGRWNPDLHDTTVSTGRQAYGGLTGEFHRVLPEAEPLDTRISNLIPVKNRASIAALGDNTLQKTLGRVAAHTGGGLGGYYGGVEGYKHGGIGGAIGGAALGVAAPEFLSSPEGQMLMARRMYGARALGPLQGAILNLPSQSKPDEE
jgi:hypothetical protein